MAFIGDVPYNFGDFQGDSHPTMHDINSENIDLVIHIGDIKSGSTECSDDYYLRILKLFNSSNAPLIYTPGDNEWVDCDSPQGGGYKPIERLQKLREMFFEGETMLGVGKKLKRDFDGINQLGYTENVRIVIKNHVVVTLNMPAMPANMTIEQEKEDRDRMTNNMEWLKKSFIRAKRDDIRAMIVALHVDPFNGVKSGFSNSNLTLLKEHLSSFNKPVLFLHGDSHKFLMDMPIKGKNSKFPIVNTNVLRVSSFGKPDMHWVYLSFASNSPGFVSVEPRSVQFFKWAIETETGSVRNFKDFVRHKRADVNEVDQYGRTPLMYSAIFGRDKFFDMLLNYDSDTSNKDIFGKTVVDYAFESKSPKIKDWAMKNMSGFPKEETLKLQSLIE